jgi:hypothetical protein
MIGTKNYLYEKKFKLIFNAICILSTLQKKQSPKVHSVTNIIFQHFHPIFGLNSQPIQNGKLGKSF